MDKKEYRVLIKHCFLMKKNIVKEKQWLDKRYGDSALGKSTIIDWYAEFKRGHTNTDDAERSSRPKSAVVLEKIIKVHKIVLDDRKLKLREIAHTLKIAGGSVFTVLAKSLGMRKLFSKWVPRLLTPDQKQQSVENSMRCLKFFKRGKTDYLLQYVTLDEQQLAKTVQSDQKLNIGLERLWHPYFGTRMLLCLSTIKMINNCYYMLLLGR